MLLSSSSRRDSNGEVANTDAQEKVVTVANVADVTPSASTPQLQPTCAMRLDFIVSECFARQPGVPMLVFCSFVGFICSRAPCLMGVGDEEPGGRIDYISIYVFWRGIRPRIGKGSRNPVSELRSNQANRLRPIVRKWVAYMREVRAYYKYVEAAARGESNCRGLFSYTLTCQWARGVRAV